MPLVCHDGRRARFADIAVLLPAARRYRSLGELGNDFFKLQARAFPLLLVFFCLFLSLFLFTSVSFFVSLFLCFFVCAAQRVAPWLSKGRAVVQQANA